MLARFATDRWIQHGFIGLLVLFAVLLHGPIPIASAAGSIVDPLEIALRLSDLAPGFAIDAATTGVAPLPDNGGTVYRIDMKREATPDAVADGPIFVQQMVARLDSPTAARALLASAREEIVREVGLAPTPDGPNDGGTVSLKKQDGDVSLYSVGFAKDQMVVYTTVGGRSSATTFPKLMDLAGISSARLDAALGK
jgi:hypothetical protein